MRPQRPRAWLGPVISLGPRPGVPLDLDGPADPPTRQNVLRIRGHSFAWVLPLLLLVLILFVDWTTEGHFGVILWIVVVPGIAAAICDVWTTAAFATVSLLAFVEEDRAWAKQYQTGLPFFILVAIGGMLATVACGLRVRDERRSRHMQNVADTTRRTVLRPLPARFGGLDHAAVYLAADSAARVGGDFYDIQPSPYGTRVLLGDVQGKGLGAVEAAAALLGTFREAAHFHADLRLVAERLETRMRRHRAYCRAIGRDEGDRFATAVLVGFPEPTPTGLDHWIDLINFGHEPPLVVGPDGVRVLPPGDALPLGLADLGGPLPDPRRVRLSPEETLLLVTDGVTEARNAAGAFFPLHARLVQVVAEDPLAAQPAHLVRLVRDGTLAHSGGHLADDTTVFAVRARLM
ncbi:PP2C family protein-serine/threonine phosphatase [Streptomyces sp. NPDC002004]